MKLRSPLAAFILLSALQAQDGRTFEQAARKAYQAKDYPLFLQNMQRANEFRPNHPRVVYNLASAFALNGKKNESLAWVERLVKMGMVYAPQRDSDFVSLFSSKEFKGLINGFGRNAARAGNATPAFEVGEKGLIAEGLAYDPVSRSFFVSSVHKRKIVRVDEGGVVSDVATAKDGLWAAMGMCVDSVRRRLWMATSAIPQMEGFVPADDGKAGILSFDLNSGKLIGRYFLSNDSAKHILGDLTVLSSGEVFATDSRSPNIYRIGPNSDAIELFASGDQFWSLQGIAASADGSFLVVSDYSRGLFRIDPTTRNVALLQPPTDATLLGIDGIYRYRDRFIGVQNGVNPQRVVEIVLSSDGKRALSLRVLAANDPLFEEPTLGVVVGDAFFFNANSQWNRIDDSGNLAPVSELTPLTVARLNLR